MPQQRRVEKKKLLEIFAKYKDKLVIPKSMGIASKHDAVWLKISEDLKNIVTVSPLNAWAIASKMDFANLPNDPRSFKTPDPNSRHHKFHLKWKHLYRAMIRRRNTIVSTRPARVIGVGNPIWVFIARELKNVYTYRTLRTMATTDAVLRNFLLSDVPDGNFAVKPERHNEEDYHDSTTHDTLTKLLKITDSLAADVKFLKKTEKFCRKILKEVRVLHSDSSRRKS